MPRLIRHLDEEGIDSCWLIAADLPGGPLAESDNAYATQARTDHPSRISFFVDADSRWSPSYHVDGAPARLARLLDRHPGASGVAHYLSGGDDDWFASGEGAAWLRDISRRGLVLSLAAGPNWYSSIATAARAVPELPIVLHHLAGATGDGDLGRLSVVAAVPNVHVKLSGAHYLDRGVGATAVAERLLEIVGVDRTVWGSDFPVDGKYVTSPEARELRVQLLAGLSESERARVTHANAERLTLGRG